VAQPIMTGGAMRIGSQLHGQRVQRLPYTSNRD
jgi:hypothetical protein